MALVSPVGRMLSPFHKHLVSSLFDSYSEVYAYDIVVIVQHTLLKQIFLLTMKMNCHFDLPLPTLIGNLEAFAITATNLSGYNKNVRLFS